MNEKLALIVFAGILLGVLVTIITLDIFEKNNSISEGATVMRTSDAENVYDQYVSYAQTHGANEALMKLYNDSEENTVTQSQCHEIAHEIGHGAFNRLGTFSEAMQLQDVTCNGGYLHGVLESAFGELTGTTTAELRNACNDLAPESFVAWQCIHGLGHGFMFAYDQDINAARNECNLYEDEWMEETCINGAYMQHFTLPLRELKDDEVLSFCDRQPMPGMLDCHLYAPTLYLARYEREYEGALRWCEAHGEAIGRRICSAGVISEMTKRNVNDIAYVWEICGISNELTTEQCVTSIISMHTNHHAALEPSYALCENILHQHKDTCIAAVESHMLYNE